MPHFSCSKPQCALSFVACLARHARRAAKHARRRPHQTGTKCAPPAPTTAPEHDGGRSDGLKVVTHNLLSDAYMPNFRRDRVAVNERAAQAGHRATFPSSDAILLDTGRYAWAHRAERIPPDLGMLWTDADIQCLQEVTSVCELPSGDLFSHASSQSPDDPRDNAVVRWRSDRFREVGHVAECMGGRKPALVVVLEGLAGWGGRRLVVVSVHQPGGEATQSFEEMDRILSAAQEAEAAAGIESGGADWIVAGDFNCPAISAIGDQLRFRGFSEVADESPACATFFADAYGMNGAKIDHIFFRPSDTCGLSCRDFAVLGTALDTVDLELLAGKREPRGPLAISDHLPVWAEFDFAGSPPP